MSLYIILKIVDFEYKKNSLDDIRPLYPLYGIRTVSTGSCFNIR